MNALPSFTSSDVERYVRLRAAGRILSDKLVKTIPPEAFEEIGTALGIWHRGTLVFDSEDETSTLMDCCIYDWVHRGKTVLERYAETHEPAPGTDEHYLLNAYLQARYRILIPKAVVAGAGIHFADPLSEEELFVMDLGLCRNSLEQQPALASRTIPLGNYWMTGGAALPVDQESGKVFLPKLEADESLRSDPHKMALTIVQACLQCGAAERIHYLGNDGEDEDGEMEPVASPRPQPVSVPRTPSRNSRCPCGSGKRYRKCCGAERFR